MGEKLSKMNHTYVRKLVARRLDSVDTSAVGYWALCVSRVNRTSSWLTTPYSGLINHYHAEAYNRPLFAIDRTLI